MEEYDWSFFEGFDDSTLIPVNLTAQEMALMRSAISAIYDVEYWSDSVQYYSDVQPLLETINFIVRQGGA